MVNATAYSKYVCIWAHSPATYQSAQDGIPHNIRITSA